MHPSFSRPLPTRNAREKYSIALLDMTIVQRRRCRRYFSEIPLFDNSVVCRPSSRKVYFPSFIPNTDELLTRPIINLIQFRTVGISRLYRLPTIMCPVRLGTVNHIVRPVKVVQGHTVSPLRLRMFVHSKCALLCLYSKVPR